MKLFSWYTSRIQLIIDVFNLLISRVLSYLLSVKPFGILSTITYSVFECKKLLRHGHFGKVKFITIPSSSSKVIIETDYS